MRDYLSPAKKYMSKVMLHPSALRAFVTQRRALAYAITASFIVITTLSFVTVRGLTNPNAENKNIVTKDTIVPGATSTVSTTTDSSVTNSQQPLARTEQPQNADNNTLSSSSSSKTSVTVNNKAVDVPANGSVHKTISDENGTTQVDISTNTSSSGSSEPNSVTSTDLNVNTNTLLQNIGIDSQ